MQKLNLIYYLLIGLFIFSACSNNDDNESELSVVGGWTVSESKLNGEVVSDQSVIRLLTADNRMEFRFLDEVDGNTELRIEKGNWTKDENILKIDFDNADIGIKIYTITELKDSSMTWESEISGEGMLKESLIR